MKSKYTKIFMIFAVVFAMFAALFVTPNFAYAEGEEEQVVTYTQETINQITDSTVKHDLQAIISSMPDTAYISFPVTYESVYGNTIEWFDDENSSVIEYDATGHWMVVNRSKDQEGSETVYVLVNKTYKYEFSISVPKGQTYVPEYTITYLDEDGTTELLSSATYKLGQKTFDLPTPSKEGHTFEGWYVNGDEEQLVTKVVVGSMSNLELHAKWSKNSYTITYVVDGNKTEVSYEYGVNVSTPADPTKTGYTFAGWDKDIPATMPAENMTITAQWEVKQYTITFNTDGGSEIAAITQDYATAVTAPADPSKTGYTFVGWDKDIPATMPAEDLTITAVFEANIYSIKFVDVNGDVLYEIEQAYGTEITETVEEPTKPGYVFAGWDQDIPTEMPLDGLTITAKWTKSEMLKLAEADRDALITQYQNLLTGEFVNPLEDALRTVGEINESEIEWFASNSAVTFDENNKMVLTRALNADTEVVLSAKVLFTDSLDTTEKYGVYAQFTITVKGVYTLTAGDVEVTEVDENYELTAEKIEEENLATEANYTLKANESYLAAYDIKFDGGQVTEFDKEVTVRIKLDKEYSASDLVVYHIDSEGKATAIASEKVSVVQDVTTGEWYVEFAASEFSPYVVVKVNKYTVTTKDGEDVLDVIENLSYESSMPELTEPEKEGYTFLGWDLDNDGNVDDLPATVDKDLVLVAVWEEEITVPHFEKVTTLTDDLSGKYIIVYEDTTSEENKIAYIFNGVDAENGNVQSSVINNKIIAAAYHDVCLITFESMEGGYAIKINGEYIYGTSGSNKLNFGTTAQLNTISFNTEGDVLLTSNTSVFRFNAASNQMRFRYYKSASYADQEAIYLYKLVGDLPQPVNSTISYDLDGGVAGANAPTTYQEGIETSLVAPTKLGYHFLGWTIEKDSVEYFETLPATTTGNITLYAHWEEMLTVTFNSNTENNETIVQYVRANTSFTLDSNTFVKDGYTFQGWATTIDSEEALYVDVYYFENGIAEDIILYAVWKENQASGSDPELVTKTYSHTFTAKQYSANGTQTLTNKNWTLSGTYTGVGYWGYDNTKGHQFGSGSCPYNPLTLTSDSFNNVSKIVINTSGASSINGSFTITVGGTPVGSSTKLTTTATAYTFEIDDPLSGPIVFSYTQTSSKAIYIKSIEVTYAE